MAYRLTAQTNKGSYRPAYYHLNEHHDLGWSAQVVAGKFHIDGIGGAPTWREWSAAKAPNRDLAVQYAEGQIQAVEAIYWAMERARVGL